MHSQWVRVPDLNINNDFMVWWCPFCLWSVAGNPAVHPADLEQVLGEHLREHVEEMCSV